MNVVVVTERHCPKGQEPVAWYLVTDEPIETVGSPYAKASLAKEIDAEIIAQLDPVRATLFRIVTK